jgi:hypothetical protein
MGVVAEEITPCIHRLGLHRQRTGGEGGGLICSERMEDAKACNKFADARGVVEARAMSMRNRAHELGICMPPRRVFVAGGASVNTDICQVFADVFSAQCVCLCVCVCVYTHTHTHTHCAENIHAYTHTNTYMHIHTQIHTCIYTHKYIHIKWEGGREGGREEGREFCQTLENFVKPLKQSIIVYSNGFLICLPP